MSDPRVFFAAERTLLAWVRTGLTIMALGFVVARFGLFLTLLAASSGTAVSSHTHAHWPSGALGTTLVLVGSAIILGAFHNYRCYMRSLPQEDIPALALPWLTPFLSLAVAAVGILLSIYLIVA
jgi:putative membrane protein